MNQILPAAILAAAVASGCSYDDTSRSNRVYKDGNQVSQPASGNLRQAQTAGYLNATDPEAYPRTDTEPY